MVDNRKYGEVEYDYDFMMEIIKEFPDLKERLRMAKENVSDAKLGLQGAEEELEDMELEYRNKVHEWEDFQPFKDAIKEESA